MTEFGENTEDTIGRFQMGVDIANEATRISCTYSTKVSEELGRASIVANEIATYQIRNAIESAQRLSEIITAGIEYNARTQDGLEAAQDSLRRVDIVPGHESEVVDRTARANAELSPLVGKVGEELLFERGEIEKALGSLHSIQALFEGIAERTGTRKELIPNEYNPQADAVIAQNLQLRNSV